MDRQVSNHGHYSAFFSFSLADRTLCVKFFYSRDPKKVVFTKNMSICLACCEKNAIFVPELAIMP